MTKFKKFLLKLFIAGILLALLAGFAAYKIAFLPNITATEPVILYIPTGSSFQCVLDSLNKYNLLKSQKTFMLTAKIKKYDVLVKAGKYQIDSAESNWHLINKLRSGTQVPVNVVVPSVRTIDRLCDIVAQKLEFTPEQLYEYLTNPDTLKALGYNQYTIPALFIPNTYQFFWNTSPEKFVERMKIEHRRFWTPERREKAEKIGLTPVQVSILASIVQAEQMQHPDERPRIAGLYLNRLRKNIALQSDPTLVFAIGDFTIKRVYDYHKKVNSPYNTYMHIGLPPGPILIPEPASIDAVLNAEKNNYLYMCAKDDFSGYHYFSTNLTQHTLYAKKYHNALNQLNIR